MFTLVSADFSFEDEDEDPRKVAVITLVTEVESDAEALGILDSIGKEFTLTPQ